MADNQVVSPNNGSEMVRKELILPMINGQTPSSSRHGGIKAGTLEAGRRSDTNSNQALGQTERSMDHVRTGMAPTLNNSTVGTGAVRMYEFGGRRFTNQGNSP